MPTVTVFEAPDVVVLLDEEAGLLLARWTRFGDHEAYRRSLDAQAEIVEDGRARFIVVDISDVEGTPSARDHDYVNRFVYPRYRRGGLRAIVTVRPRSGLTRIGTQSWNRSGRAWRFDMYETDTVDEARELLALMANGGSRSATR